jgi:tRNA modification GTPase
MAKDSSSGLSSVLAGGADTIVARATPPGRGGLAIVRVSGQGVRRIAARVCPGVEIDRGWRATLVDVHGRDGSVIDQAVAIPYPAPRSYTGEDMLEVTVHGSPWVVREVVDGFLAAGARPADPGEFTRRALANGKLDLVQAEAINELASAETAWQARLARARVSGLLSHEFAGLRDELADVLAAVEGALDFAEHEIEYEVEEIERRTAGCLDRLRRLLATGVADRRVRDGARVVITGPPNSGKSSIFNALVGRERAIVSALPGTTRDLVEAELEIDGIRVVLQDTAGLGPSEDPIEREGVRRAEGAAAAADVLLFLWPADGRDGPASPPIDGRPVLRVRSKADLLSRRPVDEGWVAVSCRTGEGLDRLRGALGQAVSAEVADLGGEAVIGERHRRALERATAELLAAEPAAPELAAEAIRGALEATRELLGEVVSDDVLDRIFAAFCIGK